MQDHYIDKLDGNKLKCRECEGALLQSQRGESVSHNMCGRLGHIYAWASHYPADEDLIAVYSSSGEEFQIPFGDFKAVVAICVRNLMFEQSTDQILGITKLIDD